MMPRVWLALDATTEAGLFELVLQTPVALEASGDCNRAIISSFSTSFGNATNYRIFHARPSPHRSD